jgi:hypothetical protein
MIGVARSSQLDDGEIAVGGRASVSPPLPPKVRALFATAKYQAPKVVSFPIDGMTVLPVTFAGNT